MHLDSLCSTAYLALATLQQEDPTEPHRVGQSGCYPRTNYIAASNFGTLDFALWDQGFHSIFGIELGCVVGDSAFVGIGARAIDPTFFSAERLSADFLDS